MIAKILIGMSNVTQFRSQKIPIILNQRSINTLVNMFLFLKVPSNSTKIGTLMSIVDGVPFYEDMKVSHLMDFVFVILMFVLK